MWLSSLRAKVLLAYAAGVVLSIGLIVAVAAVVIDKKNGFPSGADVAGLTQDMAGYLRFDAQGVPVAMRDVEDVADGDLAAAWVFDSLRQEAAYRVLDSNGKVVLSSAAGEAFWPASAPALRLQRGRFEFEHRGVVVRGATTPILRQGRIWYLQCAVSARFMQLMYGSFALPTMGMGVALFSLVLAVVFSACAFVTLKYTLKPLQRISEAAGGISPRSLQARLPAQGTPSEIAPLVESFNRVLDRLEHGYRTQQEFLATAAHELKTPLALIRAQVELGPDSAGRAELLQDVEHMSRQVQQLLHLAEASEVQNYQVGEADVRLVAEEAARYLHRMAQARDVRLVLRHPDEEVRWPADRGALFTLLKNLLENAIQHSPPGARVEVEIGSTSLAVRDWGPGASDEQLSKVFLRFWRGAHRRDEGAGLGLAICHEIAQAHGWSLAAGRADPGLRVLLSRQPHSPPHL